MKEADLVEYLQVIDSLKEEYAGRISIRTGLEIDFIPGVTGPRHERFDSLPLDYRIGSVHYCGSFNDGSRWTVDRSSAYFDRGLAQIYNGDIKSLVKTFYALIRQMVREECPDIIGHVDLVKLYGSRHFSEQEAWYRDEVFGTLEEISKSPAVIEVNTGGMNKGLTRDPYPGAWVLERCRHLKIPVTLDADAHRPEHVNGNFDAGLQVLYEAGYGTGSITDNETGIWVLV